MPRKIGFRGCLRRLFACVFEMPFLGCRKIVAKYDFFEFSFLNLQNLRGYGHLELRFPIKREIGENFQLHPPLGAP